ncbi:uncharacterized protein A4U43_C06F20140 [Asparagus officinalis]|uniref:C2 domain-containing protein n=1 Tax=Asparagus officinalis TaxID=4686 RepID=A0A5P1EQN0_ASPOF|nr:uncharacterized protein A4U43_C06F20140 [Asparagus officinalis]
MKKTKTIEDNWALVWNEEFDFQLRVPELALLQVEVHEYDMSDKDDFGGKTCLPVLELRLGIRCVPLLDHKGNKPLGLRSSGRGRDEEEQSPRLFGVSIGSKLARDDGSGDPIKRTSSDPGPNVKSEPLDSGPDPRSEGDNEGLDEEGRQ